MGEEIVLNSNRPCLWLQLGGGEFSVQTKFGSWQMTTVELTN